MGFYFLRLRLGVSYLVYGLRTEQFNIAECLVVFNYCQVSASMFSYFNIQLYIVLDRSELM
jgi:hypothetical protein